MDNVLLLSAFLPGEIMDGLGQYAAEGGYAARRDCVYRLPG